MNRGNNHQPVRVIKILLIITVSLIGAGLLGWRLGRTSKTEPSAVVGPNQPTAAAGVKPLVSYSLPAGWQEASCPAMPEAVYVIPAGAPSVNCSANTVAPVKISVDPASDTDCNQLQNNQNVKKHICISLYINGHKSLKATTEYSPSSSYKTDTTLNVYYLDTGKGVVKAEYAYTSDNQFQAGFDQLANSLKVKS